MKSIVVDVRSELCNSLGCSQDFDAWKGSCSQPERKESSHGIDVLASKTGCQSWIGFTESGLVNTPPPFIFRRIHYPGLVMYRISELWPRDPRIRFLKVATGFALQINPLADHVRLFSTINSLFCKSCSCFMHYKLTLFADDIHLILQIKFALFRWFANSVFLQICFLESL